MSSGTSVYRPFVERTPDDQYGAVLADVVTQGRLVESRQGVKAFTLMQQAMRFPLSNGFPMVTERDVSAFWRKAVGELCAFINGATTVEELRGFGCDWWGPWATAEKSGKLGLAEGDLGPGSYGGAFARFPSPGAEGSYFGFDQFGHLVRQIREQPELRTHFVSPWMPAANARGGGCVPRTTISPCHGWVHVRVLDDELHLHLYQRSGDLPVGVPANMIQYGALLLMLGQVTGFKPAVLYHTISDAHVYRDQVSAVKAMLERVLFAGARPLPTVTLNDAGLAVTDIHDFRAEHFDLADYHPYPAVGRIPVAV